MFLLVRAGVRNNASVSVGRLVAAAEAGLVEAANSSTGAEPGARVNGLGVRGDGALSALDVDGGGQSALTSCARLATGISTSTKTRAQASAVSSR